MDKQNIDLVLNDFFATMMKESYDINNIGGIGAFEKYASFEELFQYWLAKSFLAKGYKTLEREKHYPNKRDKCDIVVDDSLWVEMKYCQFTVWGCGYAPGDIIEDIESLQGMKSSGKQCLFTMIVISPTRDNPKKIENMIKSVSVALNREPAILSDKLPSKSPDAHIKLISWCW